MNARPCERCTRSSRRETRVRCTGLHSLHTRRCGAERILELSPACLVCGSHAFEPVTPTRGDVPAILSDVAHLVADLMTADASPEHVALAAAVAAASRKYPAASHEAAAS